MRVRIAILAIALAFAVAPLANAPSGALAELQTRSDDLVTAVSGSIAGHSLWFDLDTGATNSIVDASAATRLKLSSLGVGRLRGAGTGTVPVARLKPFTIRLRDILFVPRNPLAVDLSNVGAAIAGNGLWGSISTSGTWGRQL